MLKRQKLEYYWFLVLFCVGLIAGLVFAMVLKEPAFADDILWILAIAIGGVSFLRRRKFFLVTVFLAGCMLGFWRGSIYAQSLIGYERFYGKSVQLTGVVSEDISHDKSGEPSFRLRKITIDKSSYGGEIWVSTHEKLNIQRSDIVTLKGVLKEGFGGFAATVGSADIGEVTKASQSDMGLQARDGFSAWTNNIPEPERSLGLGYLLGIKNSLPEELDSQIRLLGLSHIIVASGYNLTILVTLARRLFSKTSKYLSVVFGGGMIVSFVMITGFSPSMSRAGLVSALTLLTWYYGRKVHPIFLIIIGVAVTLTLKPSYILGDLGWYLSFAAFFGVLVLAPLLHSYFWGPDKRPSYLRDIMVSTLAAQIVTLPLILHTFGTFSVYSLLANILILPIIPFCMLAVFGAGLGTALLPIFSHIVSWPATFLLKYCTFVIEKISGLPNSSGQLEFGLRAMSVSYVLMLIGVIALMLITKHNYIKDKIIVD